MRNNSLTLVLPVDRHQILALLILWNYCLVHLQTPGCTLFFSAECNQQRRFFSFAIDQCCPNPPRRKHKKARNHTDEVVLDHLGSESAAIGQSCLYRKPSDGRYQITRVHHQHTVLGSSFHAWAGLRLSIYQRPLYVCACMCVYHCD